MMAPDAIMVLAASMKQDASGRWMSTDLTEADNKLGAPGGAMRALASALLAAKYQNAIVVPSGGKGYDVPRDYPEDRPLLCEILEQELCEAGVSAERIVLERESNTTYQQLKALSALVEERGWTHVAAVTSRWHIPRTVAMIESEFPKLKRIATLVSAEEVLIANDPKGWESGIAEAYASGWLARRIEMEEQGIEKIKAGTYVFK